MAQSGLNRLREISSVSLCASMFLIISCANTSRIWRWLLRNRDAAPISEVTLKNSVPACWQVTEANGRATSLTPSCLATYSAGIEAAKIAVRSAAYGRSMKTTLLRSSFHRWSGLDLAKA